MKEQTPNKTMESVVSDVKKFPIPNEDDNYSSTDENFTSRSDEQHLEIDARCSGALDILRVYMWPCSSQPHILAHNDKKYLMMSIQFQIEYYHLGRNMHQLLIWSKF
ncbi:hypothetical protein IFM89_023694 [Coptis chinensis]|uniref:Uncharacterized protein n=1 Tax=Coptis chinensis TaxID=261450 RepID=A0A835LBL2_9MAGN|nr:hypothetical protein IFM89_023694 [Coptis chinensis]